MAKTFTSQPRNKMSGQRLASAAGRGLQGFANTQPSTSQTAGVGLLDLGNLGIDVSAPPIGANPAPSGLDPNLDQPLPGTATAPSGPVFNPDVTGLSSGAPQLGSDTGVFSGYAKDFTDFLGNTQLGGLQRGLLESLFGPGGKTSRKFLNQDLANIRSTTQQQADTVRGNARFRGSGVGEAIANAVSQQGLGQESRRLASADQEELQRALALSSGVTSGFTNPLLQALGLGTQYKLGLENLRLQRDMAPDRLDRFLGAIGGFVGGLCWVAREIFNDYRWLYVRAYMLNEAPTSLRDLYTEEGPALANAVRQSPTLRKELTPVFTEMADRGQQVLTDRIQE